MTASRTILILAGTLSALASHAQLCLNEEHQLSRACMKKAGVRELRIYRGAAKRTLAAHYSFDREGCAIRLVRYDPAGDGTLVRTTHNLSDDRLSRNWVSGRVARNGVFVRASGGTDGYTTSGKLYRQVYTQYGKERVTTVREYDTVFSTPATVIRYRIHEWTLDTLSIEEEQNSPGNKVIRKLEKAGGKWQEASRHEAVYRNGRLYESRYYVNGVLRLYWNDDQDRRNRPYGEAPPLKDPSVSAITPVPQGISDTLYVDHLSAQPGPGRQGRYRVILHFAGADRKELLYREIYRLRNGLLLQRLYPREPEQNEYFEYSF